MKDDFSRWLKFAEEDLKMAEFALKEGVYNQACFHSQQCVEKVLKGFITYRINFSSNHKLSDLLAK